ncbi:DEAD/DEAH box helicase [Chondromyces crocatus]|nr:DEAD/DEAH box helicase [Chondromyces crocatus]
MATESSPPPSTSGFAALGLLPALLSTLSELGYEEPTPIQRESIPHLSAGRDLVGQAATGTGKTAAFALPLLNRLEIDKTVAPRPTALVLVPTRELAMQVAQAVHRYGRPMGVQVLPIYGGQSFSLQLRALRRGVHVIVATPGRALDHVNRGTLTLDGMRTVVLDEADEMLDMGFAEDLEAILSATPAERQTVLFSATLPPRIAAIAGKHLRDPVHVKIAVEKTAPGELPRIRQSAYVVGRAHKPAALTRVLDMESPASALIFCRTRNEVNELTEALHARGYDAQALHGGLSQEQRDRVMSRFRSGAAELLVATDVAARGLDIDHLSHVVNYDVPPAAEVYVHRIGRTGRAGREGAAITLAEPREHRLLRNIERLTGQRIEVASLPTVADLKARRLEVARTSIREVLGEGDLEAFRSVVASLAEEFDIMDIAAAAVKLVHQGGLGDREDEEKEIPAPPPPPMDRRGPAWGDRGGPSFGDRGAPRWRGNDTRFQDRPRGRWDQGGQGRWDQGGGERRGPPRGPSWQGPPGDEGQGPARAPAWQDAPEAAGKPAAPSARWQDLIAEDERGAPRGAGPKEFTRGEGRAPAWQGPPGGEGRAPSRSAARKDQGGVTRLFVSAGHSAGIRPSDLVGAIANEASLSSRAIGAIEIADHFSMVEVPSESAELIIEALSSTRLKGRKVQVRRDREERRDDRRDDRREGWREPHGGTGMSPPRRPKR